MGPAYNSKMGKGTEGCCEDEPLLSRAEQEKKDEESKCKLRCDSQFTVEVKRPLNTCESCGAGFQHVCCNMHWWLLSCVFNAFLCPVVLTYHTIINFVAPCIVLYIEMGLCKCFSMISAKPNGREMWVVLLEKA